MDDNDDDGNDDDRSILMCHLILPNMAFNSFESSCCNQMSNTFIQMAFHFVT